MDTLVIYWISHFYLAGVKHECDLIVNLIQRIEIIIVQSKDNGE